MIHVDIVGADQPMNDIAAVDILKCHKYLHDPGEYKFLRQHFLTFLPLLDIVIQVTLLAELQYDNELIFLQVDIVVLDDMRVL